uniref:Sucrose transport protein SUC3 n=1 Tax=Aegilops tauschii TaxID=37682 RepID=M8CPV2_AEGTA
MRLPSAILTKPSSRPSKIYYWSSGMPRACALSLLKCSISLIQCTNKTVTTMGIVLSCPVAPFPITYLGLPLSVLKVHHIALKPLVNKIYKKLSTWRASLLSHSEQIALVHRVLNVMPLDLLLYMALSPLILKLDVGVRRCKHGPSAANAIFVSWMAIGNVLGYSSGSTDKWHEWFPALQTRACCEACANLKAAFLVAVIFLGFSTAVTMIFAKETPLNPEVAKQGEGEATGPLAVFKGLKNLPAGMPQVLIVTGLTWLSWFPFILFDTDWMGREIYHGRPDGSPAEIAAFQEGVRQGAFGLLLNSVLLGISSFMIEPMCRKLGARTVWIASQVLVCIAMALVAILGAWSLGDFGGNVQDAAATEKGLKTSALVLFVFLGLPFAVLCSVPFAMTAQLAASKGGGQGLCTGILNISIVTPQMIVAIGAGPWDELFGKGNIPAFALASVFAFASAVAGTIMLPKMSKSSFRSGKEMS